MPKLEVEDLPIVQPPSSVVVTDRKIILYLPDGKALIRKIGF